MMDVQGKSHDQWLNAGLGNSTLLLCTVCFIPVTCYTYLHLYDFVILAMAASVAPFIILRTRRIFLTYEHLVFIAIALWTILSYMISSDQKGFGISWCMYVLPCVLFFLLTQLMADGTKQSFTNGVLVIGFLISIQLIINMVILYVQSGGAFDLHMKANIYWAKSNYIAALLELPILWLYDRIENKQTRSRPCIIIFFLCFIALILTASRGGIITIVLSIVLYAFLKGNRISKPFIILMVFSLLYILFSKSIMHRFLHMMDLSNIFRVYLWLQSIELVLKEPLFGYGPGNVMLWANFLSSTHKMPGPHNIILEVMLHIGIGGFMLCALLLYLFIRKAVSLYKTKKDPIYLVLIFASLGHSMVEPTFIGYQYSFIFWYFMSFLVHESKVPQRALP